MPINPVTGGAAHIPENEPPAATVQPSEVAADKIGPDRTPHKHLAGVKYEDITVAAQTPKDPAPAPLTDPTIKSVIQAQLQANTPPAVHGSTTTSPTAPKENVGFNYGKIEWKYTQQHPADGSGTQGTTTISSTNAQAAPQAIDPASQGTPPVESKQKPDGTAGGNVAAKWNLKQGSAI